MSASTDVQKLPLRTLTAMVVGGMVGAGVFSIPRNFAQATGVYGALIAWTIAGAGMLMLCLRLPDAGQPQAGPRCRRVRLRARRLRPVPRLLLRLRLLGQRLRRQRLVLGADQVDARRGLPGLRRGQHAARGAISSVGIWAFHFLVLRGVKEAAGINRIVTIAKVIPLLLFVVLAIFSLKTDVFVANLSGGEGADYGNLFSRSRRRCW